MRNLIPTGPINKLLALIWLAPCLGVLIFGFVQRHIHDMPVAFVWFLIILGFPAGALAAVVTGVATGALAMAFGTQYHPFWDELPIWFAAVCVGYWQWFVFLPRQGRKFFGRGQNGA